MHARGAQSEVGKIEKILVERPEEAYGDQATLEANRRDLGYTGPPEVQWSHIHAALRQREG